MNIDYTRIKERRHEFFTMWKRMQQNGKTAFETVLQDREKRYVYYQLSHFGILTTVGTDDKQAVLNNPWRLEHGIKSGISQS